MLLFGFLHHLAAAGLPDRPLQYYSMVVLYTRLNDCDHVLATFHDSSSAWSALISYRRSEFDREFWLASDPVIFCEDRPLCYSVGYFNKKHFVRIASFVEYEFASRYLKDCRRYKPQLRWDLIKGLF